MTKLTLDMSALRNEITTIHAEAFEGTKVTSDNQRRDILLRVIERLKALKTNMDTGNVKIEVK